jgi:hypothetical protein
MANDNNFRFGGTFVFDNLSKEEFENSGFSLEISIDNGKSWLDCKKDRQIYKEIYDGNGLLTELVSEGVLAGLTENEKQLCVTFGLNVSYFTDSPTVITGGRVAGQPGIIMRLRNDICVT